MDKSTNVLSNNWNKSLPPLPVFWNETSNAFILWNHRKLIIKSPHKDNLSKAFPTADQVLLYTQDTVILPSTVLCIKYFELDIITTDFLLEKQLDFYNYTILNI